MDENQVLIYEQDKPFQLNVQRAVYYLQSGIVEAFSEDNRVYYLFFYKDRFLAAFNASTLGLDSFIAHAFRNGIVFLSPHPFINKLLTTSDSYKLTDHHLLLKNLQRRYNPHERANILTFFESFIPKQELLNEVKSIFYVYRRNGQGFLGYRIIRILTEFAPESSWVKEISGDTIFSKYADQYNRETEELFAKDPIFAEKILYSRKDDDQSFQRLTSLLEKESRWNDLLALQTYKFTAIPSDENYLPFKKLLQQQFNETDFITCLERLSQKTPEYLLLQQELFNLYVKNKQLEKAASTMKKGGFLPTHEQVDALSEMLDEMDPETHPKKAESMKGLLESVIKQHPEKMEELLSKFVTFLLGTHEPGYIQQWLKPFREGNKNIKLFSEIDTMEKMSDDLDRMGQLGELYYKYGQLDKAIECFSWEMELKPDDTEPLQWLAQLYRKMGRKHESEAYQQLYISMQKQA